jgi:hypothetical protein
MSSVTSSFAQIAGRTKFLLATSDLSGYVVDGLHSTVAVSQNVPQGYLVAASKVAVLGTSLLKDLGRQIVLYDDARYSNHIATFRQVQLVKGSTTEGVAGGAPGSPDLAGPGSADSYFNTCYVCVYSNDPTYPVKVARTG